MDYEEARGLLLAGKTDDGRLREGTALPLVVRALGESEAQVPAARLLSEVGCAAVPALIGSWKNRNLDIIIKAAVILGEIVKKMPEGAQEQVVSVLIRGLGGDIWERTSSAWMLCETGLRRLPVETQVVCLLLMDRNMDIAMLGEPALPELARILRNDAKMRRKAAHAIAMIGLKKLENPEDRVLCILHLESMPGAGEYLREIANMDQRAVQILIGSLKDDDRDVRKNAAVALANIASVAGISMGDVRAALMEYIGRAREKGLMEDAASAMAECAGLYKLVSEGVRKRLAREHGTAECVPVEGAGAQPGGGCKMYARLRPDIAHWGLKWKR